MILIDPSYEILTDISLNGVNELKEIELIARNCYKSENCIQKESYKDFIGNLIRNNHTAMLEHGYLSVKITCSRAVANELVRHRMASFAQESQRYCNYSKDKFLGSITFIKPKWYDPVNCKKQSDIFDMACEFSEHDYFKLLDIGLYPQEAREVLCNACKTDIIITANYREWRHIFKLRCDKASHPEMRRIMIPLREDLKNRIGVIFDDLV